MRGFAKCWGRSEVAVTPAGTNPAARKTSVAAVALGGYGGFGQVRGGDADALEALGDDAVWRTEHRNQDVHLREVVAAVVHGAGIRVAQ